MNLRRATDGEGWEPEFPSGMAYGLLADLRSVEWGIYQFSPSDEHEGWKPERPVSSELAALIWSGKRYPPALALARYDLRQRFRSQQPSQDEFEEAYAAVLKKRLSQQTNAPFLMAKALRGDGIDLAPGEWHWILRIQRTPPVALWVSDDYHVYESPVADFVLTDSEIERLRRA